MRTYIFRGVGALNLLFATLGLGALALQSWAFSLFPSEVAGADGDSVRLAFRISQLSSLALLPPLAYFGARLMRSRTKLITPCAFLFAAEIVYLGLSGLLWPWIFSPSILTSIRSGLLNLGFGLQVLTGYPLLGLAALYFLHKGGLPTAGSRQELNVNPAPADSERNSR
jgi:hypothetical protein